MDWSIGNEVIASLIASAIIYGVVRFIKTLRNTSRQQSTQEIFDEIVDRDMAKIPKLKIKPLSNHNRRIKISGTGSKTTIAPGGPLDDSPISVSGTGASRTIYVSEYNKLLISVSGTGSILRLDKSLKASVIDLKVSGTGAEVIWGKYD